jgi:hypothetical protein
MVALKTHKTLQHVSIHFWVILRELVSSLLKSLIKTVEVKFFGDAAAYRRVCVRAVQCRAVCRPPDIERHASPTNLTSYSFNQ